MVEFNLSKNIRKSKLKKYIQKLFLIVSLIPVGVTYPTKVISQQLSTTKINEIILFSNKSFISKAVERTGAAVVTIDTQRYVKKRDFPRNSQLFLDPYIERFFGLDLPNENRSRIEQNQGSGFIFADGLVMTNAHVVNGSCLLYTSPSPRDGLLSRMPSSA